MGELVHVAELWRYPVKSMAGERLDAAAVGALGIPGDRALVVVDAAGRIQDARTRPALLRHRASLDAAGRVRVDGLDWETPEVASRVRAAAGPGARLMAVEGAERFDIMPLLVATDGAIAALGVDRRRLRPNLLIGGVSGLAERGWEGRYLAIGSAVIGFADLRGRCIMTTWDPDTGAQDAGVLHRIVREFGGTFALNAWVARAGEIAEGDSVSLMDRFEGGEPPLLGRYAR